MGPGDDAPIVGGESAQSHPTRDDSYTHLNAMNPKDEAMSTDCFYKRILSELVKL